MKTATTYHNGRDSSRNARHTRDWGLFWTTSPLVSANFVRGILVKDEYVPRATIRMAAILLDSTDQKRTVDDHHIRENEDSDFGGEL